MQTNVRAFNDNLVTFKKIRLVFISYAFIT